MQTAHTATGSGTDTPAPSAEPGFVSGTATGKWQAREYGVSVSWLLEQKFENQQDYQYLVRVEYRNQTVVEVRHDGRKDGKTLFNVRDPEGLYKPVSGVIRVERQRIGATGSRLDLLVELTNDPAQPGMPQLLASCHFADELEQPVPDNDPVAAPADTSKAPYCFVGQLRMEFRDKFTGKTKRYIGTATVVAAPHDRTGLYLLTCAHNLYDLVDKKATKVSFVPGLNKQDPAPAEFEAEEWYYPDNYVHVATTHHADPDLLSHKIVQLNKEYDYGLVRLKAGVHVPPSPAPQPVAATDEQLDEHPEVTLYGLYGWDKDDDNAMFVGNGRLEKWEPHLLQYGVSTRQGSSGTAVCWSEKDEPDELKVVGVHDRSGPADDSRKYNIGHRITEKTLTQLRTWMDDRA